MSRHYFFLPFSLHIAIKHFFSHMQEFLKKSGVFYKKAHFLHFSFKIFGGLEKKLYLCSRKQKQV